ncbi:hypothetical protein CC85DRAFT_283769 [Cutaneotrichosporon oleaginosum]|uniref:Ser-Thr-rich glycosyl-phosphatidyl-inositol-anchored membrane family-domain-containing protein n=1 Tax=Cutaneotrichosporon oleaginosum TaxID=879819 RepID=A0A0J0XT48_9TREE|nr:uncharacterized protein CC85DRAFT_283769 [Cutaneotrichosporon oleaginosum]KLT44255.1 hypothetical protein CC85DRAFT_283769 [Cutaneotrichosporon oleaginosum]TXT11577.1 hypothetical protein COLE_01987 [Cutaneotrichosporon oleaginosum]
MLFGALALLANAASALAAIQVIQPSKDLWWVNNGQNTLAWTGSAPPNDFVVMLSNPDTKLLTADNAIGAIAQTYMYSLTVLPVKWNAGTGYTIKLVNPLNGTDVYAVSEPFEIKPEGSTYATGVTSAAGTLAATSSDTAANTTASSAAATPTSNGAMSNAVPAAAAVAVAGAAYLLA